MTVTQKSPKQFRFTFVSRLQNLALSAIENLFRANDVFVSRSDIYSQKERLSYQRSAMTDLKLLGYIALLSMEQGCILPKQYEQISRKIADCQNLLGAWMNSDPVSSDSLKDIERELYFYIEELQKAVVENDANAIELCKKTKSVLAERNRLCKLNKNTI